MTASQLAELHKVAKARKCTVTDCGGGHWQIRGRLLVNYYPDSKKRSAYVAGTTSARERVSPTEAVHMAMTPPPVAPKGKKAKRKAGARIVRITLLRRSSLCHWCHTKLTIDTSTIDHIVPIARGGLDNANNYVLACEPCNKRRGCDMPEVLA